MNKPLDSIGECVVRDLRDVALSMCEGMRAHRFQSPGHRAMQDAIRHLSASDLELLTRFVAYCVDGGINDFLARIDAAKIPVAFAVRGALVEKGHSLHRMLHGDSGWIERFSAFDRCGMRKTAQPGATDNPDDAQRLREDHRVRRPQRGV